MIPAPNKVVDLQQLGERLLLTRRRKGLSQGDLSTLAHCDLSLISRIERGVKPSLSVEVLGRLARALDVSPNDLLGWGEPAQAAPSTTRPREDTHEAMPTAKRQRTRKAAVPVA
jgi:transcriptional regulator with XRE-family HTH domain